MAFVFFVFVVVASSFLVFLFVVDFFFPASSSSAWRFREAAARPRMHALETGHSRSLSPSLRLREKEETRMSVKEKEKEDERVSPKVCEPRKKTRPETSTFFVSLSLLRKSPSPPSSSLNLSQVFYVLVCWSYCKF